MNSSKNVWGESTITRSKVKLHDLMDEELAQKLQEEEENQWKLEFNNPSLYPRKTGWCFAEVPSENSNSGAMSVIEREISIEDSEFDVEDPDYQLALELQAQEADEYDRLRRQEASSMERIRIIQQEDPKRDEIRQVIENSSYKRLQSHDIDDEILSSTMDRLTPIGHIYTSSYNHARLGNSQAKGQKYSKPTEVKAQKLGVILKKSDRRERRGWD